MAYYDPSTGILQGGTGTAKSTQGSAPAQLSASTGGLSVQGPTNAAGSLQRGAIAPAYNQTLAAQGQRSSSLTPTNVGTAVDPAAAAAAQKAAQDAAQAAALRGQITGLVNSVKDIFNSRYGQVDAGATEQVGKLNTRFGDESQTITQGVTDENNTAGATFAGRGTRDSSDYGNTVDTITRAGESQVKNLGTELQDNLSKIASWVTTQKGGFDAGKQGVDQILSHIAEQTDPNSLATIRNQLESKIIDLQSGSAANNTEAQNLGALNAIAPSSARAVQLKTTLAQIVGGAADPGQKSAVGAKLIQSAGLTPDEQQRLLAAFQSDLGSADNKQIPTA